ncbi:MAG: fibronectin type III domain-containing protein, partial [Ruminiclostridium sp.]|nr:fibronectin type III domain-containing protein [Ruminiclostridium sp.]
SSYLNTIAARTLPAAVTGFKLTARTSTSIKLGWDKNASAGGYIVEQYKNGKWVSVAKLSKATTSYRVTGLKAGATYKFRIKAYTTSGITKLYSGYQTISVKTAN